MKKEQEAKLYDQIVDLEATLRSIRNLCDAPHWTVQRRWQIRDMCNKALNTPHGE